ncbi:MAG: DNA-binding response regulator [Alphaproteobacteria bacterium]|nr:MAG: DNA-binding response regulator [Alphaproteobacteria bacterium]
MIVQTETPLQVQSQSPAPARVVIVDDDDLFRESLGLNLAEEGYDVVDFPNGESVLAYFEDGNDADAVLLDWRMPGLDGLGVLRRLREARNPTPVIFLTMLSDDLYEEEALRWGAVDFIDKSRRLPIILGRLKLITEGTKRLTGEGGDDQTTGVLARGPLELHLDIHRAFWRGRQVDLTLSEFAIVHFMVAQVERDVTYRQIYDIVRGKDFVAGYGAEGYRANVRSFIKRIRKKFRDVDPDFDRIDNYPGFGYRWRAEPGDNAASVLAAAGDGPKGPDGSA